MGLTANHIIQIEKAVTISIKFTSTNTRCLDKTLPADESSAPMEFFNMLFLPEKRTTYPLGAKYAIKLQARSHTAFNGKLITTPSRAKEWGNLTKTGVF